MDRTLFAGSALCWILLAFHVLGACGDERRAAALRSLQEDIQGHTDWRVRDYFAEVLFAGRATVIQNRIQEGIQQGIDRAQNEDGRDGPIPPENEVVMAPGTKITATTSEGPIVITAGKGLQRSYTWEGATRSVEMWPRKERWYGSLGLYFPGPGHHWKEHKGITRGVVEEGQQHFATTEEALEWIANRKYMPFVHRSDGLMIGWGKDLHRKILNVRDRNQLTVEVWQIYIDGKKPKALPGSQDDQILVEEAGSASPPR